MGAEIDILDKPQEQPAPKPPKSTSGGSGYGGGGFLEPPSTK